MHDRQTRSQVWKLKLNSYRGTEDLKSTLCSLNCGIWLALVKHNSGSSTPSLLRCIRQHHWGLVRRQPTLLQVPAGCGPWALCTWGTASLSCSCGQRIFVFSFLVHCSAFLPLLDKLGYYWGWVKMYFADEIFIWIFSDFPIQETLIIPQRTGHPLRKPGLKPPALGSPHFSWCLHPLLCPKPLLSPWFLGYFLLQVLFLFDKNSVTYLASSNSVVCFPQYLKD